MKRALTEPLIHASAPVPLVLGPQDLLAIALGHYPRYVLGLEVGVYRVGFGFFEIRFTYRYVHTPVVLKTALGYLDIKVAKIPAPIFLLGFDREKLWGISFATEGYVTFRTCGFLRYSE